MIELFFSFLVEFLWCLLCCFKRFFRKLRSRLFFAEGGQDGGGLFAFRGSIGVSEARSEWASAVGKEPVRPAAEATVLAIWFCRGAIRPRATKGRGDDDGTFSPHEKTDRKLCRQTYEIGSQNNRCGRKKSTNTRCKAVSPPFQLCCPMSSSVSHHFMVFVQG